MIRQLFAANAAGFVGLLPKVVVCIVLAGACARPAGAELVVIDSGFTNSTATTLSYVTNRYDGHGHVISDDLTLSNVSYLRLKGGTSSAPDRLDVGPADANAANQCPVITVGPDCGFYCTYRNSGGNPDPDTQHSRSFLETYIGANGGSAKFVVQSDGSNFGSNIKNRALWLEDVFVSENATSDGDYLDIVQLDAGGAADIDYLVNNNAKPARILFNGGYLYDNQNQHNDYGLFNPASGKKIVLEGINGKDVKITKAYYGHNLNDGLGTLRFQGDCNVVLDDGGFILPGLPGANRSALTLNSAKGPIEWGQKGDLILAGQAHIKCAGDNRLPYTDEEGIVRMRETKSYGAILDLDNTSQRVRSLIAEGTKPMVTNVAHSAYTDSKLVFGYGNTDGIFAARCTYGVSVEKVGSGTLVISNATVEGTVTIKEGKVKFAGVNNLPNLVIEEGVEVIAGLEETTDSIKRLVVGSQQYSGKISFAYGGSGETLLRAGDELSGMKLNVGSGKIRFAGDSSDKWWRLVMLQAANVTETTCSQANHVEMTEFSLYASNVTAHASKGSTMLNYGLQTNETGTAWTSYSQMPSGTCTEGFGEMYTWSPSSSGRKWWGVSALCGNSGAACFQTAGTPSVRDATPRHIIYRLKDTSPAVSSYTVCYTQWSNTQALKKWRLESSSDGENWTVRDEHEAQWANTSACATTAEKRAKSEIPAFACGTDGYYNNGVPYRLTQGASAAESFTNVSVSVASGATLDTTYIKDDVLSFAELNVDTVGGTITKFAPMVNGRINLANIALTMEPRTVMTVSQMINPENLNTWKVYVDGVEYPAASIVLDGTELKVELVQTDAVWTAGGDDTSTKTAENWKGSVAPSFRDFPCPYRPVFGEGGSEAVFPSGTSYLNGLKFNREGDFTVRGAADTKLKLYDTVEVAAGKSELDQRRYDIAAPLEVTSNAQTFNVPTNRTLCTSGGITNAEGVSSVVLTKQGLGKLELVNSRVAGDVVATDPDCGILSLSGDIGVPGDSGQLILQNYSYHWDSTARKYGAIYRGYMHLDNATIYKPFDFQSGGSVTCTNGNNSTTWLTQTPGSTNVFMKRVTHTGSSTWLLNSDSTIVFEEGYGDPQPGGGGLSLGMWAGCTNGTFIFNGPMQMINTSKGTTDVSAEAFKGAKVIIASTGNICTNYYKLNYMTTVFTVDDAFTGTKYFVCNANDTVVDLTTTRQSIPICWLGYGRGELKGEYPSEIAITRGPANESAATTTNFYPSAINGWVKISKAGDGYQKIGATATKAYASYGDLEVSGGTLELLSGTTWLNGTNFICRGTGTLKLTSTTKAQIGPQARVHFDAVDANAETKSKISIPSDVTYTVDSIWVGDTRLAPGVYDGSEDEPVAGRITGGGSLRVKSGMMFIFR